jgi:hypothetical protein
VKTVRSPRTDPRSRLEEGHPLVQDLVIPARADILGHDVRQPQQIVGAAGAEPAARRLVPPVLHVAFDELPAGGPQQVRARQIRPREGQRQDVLQLIAEAEGAAGLVVPGPRPHAAAHGLIEQPPIHQHVEGIVGRPHLDRTERLLPVRLDLGEGGHRGVHASVTRSK